MSKNVATGRATRREVTKFSLTHQQVMELSVRRIPVSGGAGKRAKLVERPAEQGDKAYRVLDGNQGAPVGFGFYVGKTRTTYEVVRRGAQGVRRFALGNVTDMGLEEAYSVARELIHELKASGENPKTRVWTLKRFADAKAAWQRVRGGEREPTVRGWQPAQLEDSTKELRVWQHTEKR